MAAEHHNPIVRRLKGPAIMRKLLLASAIAALPFAAHAGLFTAGSSITISGTDAADGNSFSNVVSLPTSPGAISYPIDNGNETVTIYDIPTSGGGDWLMFSYQTRNGGNLAAGNGSWKLEESAFSSPVGTLFDAAFGQFYSSGGVLLTPTNGVFPGYAAESNPIPGAAGLGFASTGIGPTFAPAPIAANTALDFFAFLSPFSQLTGDGINPNLVTGWVQALHFDPQAPPPPLGASEPASLALLGFGLLGLVAARRRHPSGGPNA